MPDKIYVYTDGSFVRKPNVGGWAVRIMGPDGGDFKLSGSRRFISSVEAEIFSIKKALRVLMNHSDYVKGRDVILFNDCLSAMDGFSPKFIVRVARLCHSFQFKHIDGHKPFKSTHHLRHTWADRQSRQEMRSKRDFILAKKQQALGASSCQSSPLAMCP